MRDRKIKVGVIAPVIVPETEQECQTVVCGCSRLSVSGCKVVRDGCDFDCAVKIQRVTPVFKSLAKQVSQCLGCTERCGPLTRPWCCIRWDGIPGKQRRLSRSHHLYRAVERWLVTRINRVTCAEI